MRSNLGLGPRRNDLADNRPVLPMALECGDEALVFWARSAAVLERGLGGAVGRVALEHVGVDCADFGAGGCCGGHL